MKHLSKKRSQLSPSKNNNDEGLEGLYLQKSNLNVSAGRKFYEKAKSRRSRHRLALMTSDQSSDAVPLGKGGKRGPGGTATIAGETAKNKRVRWIGFSAREREEEEDKVQELIESSGASTGRKSKISPALRKVTSPSRGNPTLSRPRIIKNSKQSKACKFVESERMKQMKRRKL